MAGLGGKHADSDAQSSSVSTEESRRFDTALFAASDALTRAKISFAVIGGVAASGLGRPRSTEDIDIFVRPEDAEAALEVLGKDGFRTEKTNPMWLFKAFYDGVLVDMIFQSKGGIYFDDEMRDRAVTTAYHGREIRLVSPEDFIIIKCAVHSEEGPHHWHDALAVLSQAKLDWNYLLHRARKAPRRLLALLVYAQSSDIWIPNQPIVQLYQTIFGDVKTNDTRPATDIRSGEVLRATPATKGTCDEAYLAAQIKEALVQNELVGGTNLDVWVGPKQITVRGQCVSGEQKEAILSVVRSKCPGYPIGDQLQIPDWDGPQETRELA